MIRGMDASPTAARLCALLERFGEQRIAVVGDLALDEYVHGRTSRISREAPVLILRHVGGEQHPGCAGNSARNVAALGGAALAVGELGDDDAGRTLLRLLSDCGVDCHGLVVAPGATTWRKTRFLAGDLHTVLQQVMRLDHEPNFDRAPAHRAALHAALERALEDATGVLLCDYGGGVLDAGMRRLALEAARRRGIPVVADSRYALHEFTGVTCATPNETEIEPIVGRALEDDAAVEAAGEALRRRLEAASLVVTRGKLGMTIFDGGRPRHLPAFGNEAKDVAGAGDTVAASVALSLAAGGSVHDAARLANYAASRVVMVRGTAVTNRDEVRACLERDRGLD
jgi:rfaE bifunctional protein kinase chain/domain